VNSTFLEDDSSVAGDESDVDNKPNRKRLRKCSYHNCGSKWSSNMFRIPSIYSTLPQQYYSHNFERLLRASKCSHRNKCLQRIGVSTNADDDVDYRICGKHATETINKNVAFVDLKYNTQTVGIDMVVPVAYNDRTILGESSNRNFNRLWRNKIEATKRLSGELAAELGINNEQFANVILQMLKKTADESQGQQVDCRVVSGTANKMKVKLTNHNNKFINRKPRVLLSDMDDRTLSFLTGFPSLSCMICYILLIEQGDIDNIIHNRATRTLTWFEEWLVVLLERLCGRSLSRWTDASIKYGVSERQLTQVFDNKIEKIKKMRLVWGLFASLQEDQDLRMAKWESDFAKSRLIMWDNTNVPLCFLPRRKHNGTRLPSIMEGTLVKVVSTSNLAVGWGHMSYGWAQCPTPNT
jgi:hypothetical protein